MFDRLLNWLRGESGRKRGDSCESCCHFVDYSSDDDLPDEPNGYCGALVDKLGLGKAIKVNPYGGHWTHSGSWCGEFEAGQPLWNFGIDEAQSGDVGKA